MEKFEAQGFISELSLKIDAILRSLNTYFAEVDNVRIISFLLLVLAIALFLFLVVVVYIRHILSIIKSNKQAKNISKNEEKDENIGVADIFGIDDEDELERELQKEL
ncbi:MAG: hypothetical protein IKA30_01290, partial [Alphaproteobacteria bacterium]|nr:hypothetical protein [Alphaproteobacteria bacterium]